MIDKTEQDAPYGSVALPLGELLFDGGDARDLQPCWTSLPAWRRSTRPAASAQGSWRMTAVAAWS